LMPMASRIQSAIPTLAIVRRLELAQPDGFAGDLVDVPTGRLRRFRSVLRHRQVSTAVVASNHRPLPDQERPENFNTAGAARREGQESVASRPSPMLVGIGDSLPNWRCAQRHSPCRNARNSLAPTPRSSCWSHHPHARDEATDTLHCRSAASPSAREVL
jgi:hypothetical protein